MAALPVNKKQAVYSRLKQVSMAARTGKMQLVANYSVKE